MKNNSQDNSNTQSNTHSHGLTGPLHEVNKLEPKETGNEMLNYTMTQKKPATVLNKVAKKADFGFVDDYDLSQAYKKLSHRKIEVEYDSNAVYGKPSNRKVENILGADEGNKDFKTSTRKEKEKNFGIRTIKEENNILSNEELDSNYKISQKGTHKISEYYDNQSHPYRGETSRNDEVNYEYVTASDRQTPSNININNPNDNEEENENDYTYINGIKVPKIKKYTFIQNQNNDNRSPINKVQSFKNSFVSPHPVRLSKDEKTPMNQKNKKSLDTLQTPTNNNQTYFSNNLQSEENMTQVAINPNNKNFEVYFKSNNFGNDLKTIGQMQYYPPYHGANNLKSSTNSGNYNKIESNNLNCSSNSNNSNKNNNKNSFKLSKEKPSHQSSSLDGKSCDHCEQIYKMSIFNKLPLKILKCVHCSNVINNDSLDFYLKKYKKDLIKMNKETININDEEEEHKKHKTHESENDSEEEKYELKQREKFKANKVIDQPPKHSKRKEIKNESETEEKSPEKFRQIDDDWVGWINNKKKIVKENLQYAPKIIKPVDNTKSPSNDNCTHNNNFEYAIPGEKKDEGELLNENGPSVSEMFKQKKSTFANRMEKRKEKKNKEESKDNELTHESTQIIKTIVTRKVIVKTKETKGVKNMKKSKQTNPRESNETKAV